MTAVAESELPVEIRPMRPTDYQFVFETTVKVRWPRRNSIPWGEWKMMHGPMVDHWMRDGQVHVAESGGVLLGFVVLAQVRTPPPAVSTHGEAVAMLYVKRGFRGDGIGARLIKGHTAWPLLALLPTPSWQRWCELRGVKWERAAC